MCWGGSQPKMPKIKYIGPSDSDIRRNEESLRAYQQQISTQQSAFQAELQSQIDAANAETDDLRAQYADDLASAKADSAAGVSAAEAAGVAALAEADASSLAQQVGSYQVTASQSEPVQAQTTAAIDKKKKPKRNLRISTAGTASSAGSGLNIGV